MTVHNRNTSIPHGTGVARLVSREGTAGPYTWRGHVAAPRDIVAAVHARLAALGRLPEPPDPEPDGAGVPDG